MEAEKEAYWDVHLAISIPPLVSIWRRVNEIGSIGSDAEVDYAQC